MCSFIHDMPTLWWLTRIGGPDHPARSWCSTRVILTEHLGFPLEAGQPVGVGRERIAGADRDGPQIPDDRARDEARDQDQARQGGDP